MALECLDVSRTAELVVYTCWDSRKSETPWPEEESQMDAEWISGTRPKRKQRRDAGTSKRWAPDSLLDMMPAYVNVNDLITKRTGTAADGEHDASSDELRWDPPCNDRRDEPTCHGVLFQKDRW